MDKNNLDNAELKVGCKGRKRKIEVFEPSGIKKKICDGALILQEVKGALTLQEVKIEIQQTILKKMGLNSLANIDKFAAVSDRTVANYIKDMDCVILKNKVLPRSSVYAAVCSAGVCLSVSKFVT